MIASSRNDFAPRYSPDGTQIAFYSDRLGSTQLWVANADGSNESQLTSQPALLYFAMPQWSPDGRHILFFATAGGQLRYYLVRATGSEPVLFSGYMSGWSRDGKWIYYSSSQAQGGQIWRKPAAGGEPVQVALRGGFFMCESPDGKFAYFWKGTSPPSIWRVPVGGGEEIEILHAINHPSNVCITDQGIYFLPVRTEAQGGSFVIRLLRLATGKIEAVAAIDKDTWVGLTVSPNGRWLLYSQLDHATCDLMLVENFR
ncbi:MAG: hypothetical protein FJW35_03860 [Acidobacteria bacterium]|nr:hypothetical protein [Acidobacteriota bacterium]